MAIDSIRLCHLTGDTKKQKKPPDDGLNMVIADCQNTAIKAKPTAKFSKCC